MHRQPLLSLLKRHRPSDGIERDHLDNLIEFVEREPHCFDRATQAGHVTGSAFIVDGEKKSTLLVHHRKLNRWLQPGGHADGETNALNVALREAHEETGLQSVTPLSQEIFDVDIHLIPARKDEPQHYHYDVRFLLVADKDEPLIISDESNDLQWFNLDRIRQIDTDESVLRMITKLKRQYQ